MKNFDRKAYYKKYVQEHKKENALRCRIWRELNSEKRAEHQKRYCEKNKHVAVIYNTLINLLNKEG